VRWTFQTVLDTENVLAGYLDGVTKVEALDDLTLRLTLDQPNAKMTSIWIPLLPKHKWTEANVKAGSTAIQKFAEKLPIVGTGPFKIVKVDKKGTTELERNEFFWGEPKPAMERILLTVFGDQEGALRELRGKRLDAIVSGNSKWVNELQGQEGIKVWSTPEPGFTSIGFNSCPPGGAGTCTGPAKNVKVQVVQDPAIRKALAHVIDRQNLVDDVFSGQAEPGNGLISPYYSRFFESYADDPEVGYPHDPEKARQILADAGWVCPDGGICEKDGVKAQFELMTRVEQLDDQNASKRIKAWAREIGIDIKLSPVSDDAISNATYATGTEDDKYGPSYDAFLWGWSGDVPSPDFNFDVLRTNSAWQDTYYSNPEYDRVSLQSLHTLDEEERIDLMHEAERIALRDLPYIYLVHDHTIYVTRTDTFHNWQQSPAGEAGAPLTTNWLQLTSLQEGPEPEPEPEEVVAPASSDAAAATTEGEATTAAAAEPDGTTAETVAAAPDADGDDGGLSTGVVVLIALLAISVVAIIALLATRGRRGGREPLEWDD
jgi:peptide/nickel transport system substrate-binding protein